MSSRKEGGGVILNKNLQDEVGGRTRKNLAVLEVVEEDVKTFALDTVVFDDYTRASDHFTRVTLAVDLAETSPGSEDFGVSNLILS